MEIVLTEWLAPTLRWLHVIAGIAWIGSSFYFIHLDLSLKAREGLPGGVKGDAWQVHGGGFYQMIKFLVAPAQMPDELTWFKWEAYTTWLSGFALLVLIYYLNADLFLIDKSVLAMSATQAAAIAFVSLAAAWLAYEALCRSPLGKHEVALALVGYRVPGRAHLWLHACVQRARRLHPDRRADRHHHGGERLRHHHPLPEEDGGRAHRRQEPDPPGARSASSARCTTTT